MENNSYFNYFTEIEDHFQRRRGTTLILSTLDWMLIETWKDAGLPLEAVLRGIDNAFDKYDARPRKTQKINGLAWCSQAVLAAAEDMKAAAEGATRAEPTDTGFEAATVATYLERNSAALESLLTSEASRTALPDSARAIVEEQARTLRELASSMANPRSGAAVGAAPLDVAPGSSPAGSAVPGTEAGTEPEGRCATLSLEDLERRLTVMEEKLLAALLAATADEQIVQVRSEADRDLGPYRRKMSGPQIEQLHKQYVHKRLLERYGIPRLSLFYM